MRQSLEMKIIRGIDCDKYRWLCWFLKLFSVPWLILLQCPCAYNDPFTFGLWPSMIISLIPFFFFFNWIISLMIKFYQFYSFKELTLFNFFFRNFIWILTHTQVSTTLYTQKHMIYCRAKVPKFKSGFPWWLGQQRICL